VCRHQGFDRRRGRGHGRDRRRPRGGVGLPHRAPGLGVVAQRGAHRRPLGRRHRRRAAVRAGGEHRAQKPQPAALPRAHHRLGGDHAGDVVGRAVPTIGAAAAHEQAVRVPLPDERLRRRPRVQAPRAVGFEPGGGGQRVEVGRERTVAAELLARRRFECVEPRVRERSAPGQRRHEVAGGEHDAGRRRGDEAEQHQQHEAVLLRRATGVLVAIARHRPIPFRAE
jgi:hypothetical protein